MMQPKFNIPVFVERMDSNDIARREQAGKGKPAEEGYELILDYEEHPHGDLYADVFLAPDRTHLIVAVQADRAYEIPLEQIVRSVVIQYVNDKKESQEEIPVRKRYVNAFMAGLIRLRDQYQARKEAERKEREEERRLERERQKQLRG